MGDETAPEQEYAWQTSDPDLAGQEDVVLDVPTLHVDSLDLDLTDLRARVSLNAEVLSLLRLHVGVDLNLGQASLDLRGADAQALLKVRLENVVSMIDRVLQTIDSHPEIVEPLVRGVQEALRPNGYPAGHAPGQVKAEPAGIADAVGEGAKRAAQRAGRAATHGVQEAGRRAAQTAREAGHRVAQATHEAGQGAPQESRRPDIEARAGSDADSDRRVERGKGSQNGEGERLYRGMTRRVRRRR
jgi:hypothetical protein